MMDRRHRRADPARRGPARDVRVAQARTSKPGARRGRRVVRPARGEILALVGESGCGKTSIAHAVMRLVSRRRAARSCSAAQDITTLSDRDAASDPRGHPDGVPGPVRVARPAADRLRPGRGAADDPRPSRRARPSGATRVLARDDRCRTASAGRDRATSSAPPLGRPAPARGDRRPRWCSTRSVIVADEPVVDARRVAPRRDPPADARPARAAPGLVPVHHARPLARLGRGRSHRRGLPRPDRGDRCGGRRHREPPAPVHEGARLGDPRAGDRQPPPSRSCSPARRRRPRTIPIGCRFHPRCWRYDALGRARCMHDDSTRLAAAQAAGEPHQRRMPFPVGPNRARRRHHR